MKAQELLGKIRAGSATTEEMAQGVTLLKAIEAYEGDQADPNQINLLTQWEVIEPDAATPPPAAAATTPAAPNAAQIQADAIQKALEALGDGPTDLPEAGDLAQGITDQGGQQALNVAPVLQAQVATYDRVAKALEDLTVATLAQNNLLATVAQGGGNAGLATELAAVKGQLTEQGEILKALAAPGAENPLLKALGTPTAPGGQMANALTQALERIAGVEQTLNNRGYSGNPPRGTGLLKNMNVGGAGDIPFNRALEAIQKSAKLQDYEKSEALATLQIAVDTGRPFLDVLKSYQIDQEGLAYAASFGASG